MHRDRHPFLWGRPAARLLSLQTVVAWSGAYLLWAGSVEGSRCGVSSQELVLSGFALVAAWSLAPRMASWEAAGSRRIGPLTAVGAAIVLVVASTAPLAVYAAVTSLPPALVPGSDRFTLEGYGPDVWSFVVTNLAVTTAITLIAVGSLGRSIGALVALVVHVALFALSARTSVPVPYAAACGAETNPPTWLPAAVVVVPPVRYHSATAATPKTAAGSHDGGFVSAPQAAA